MSRDAARAAGELLLWRLRFVAPGPALPDLLDVLEEHARAVSAFEHEADENKDTLTWQVELLLDDDPDRTGMRDRVTGLCAPFGFAPYAMVVEEIDEAEWLKASRAPMAPVEVGRFVVHGESTRDRVLPDAVGILVEAGMAFGSGEHATTQGCLAAVDLLARRRRFRRVLDLGCGSAVLAIAAAKCWPCRATAADIDPVAVRVARENVAINGVEAQVRCVTSDGCAHPAIVRGAPYDLVLANILADPVSALARPIARLLAPDGRVVLSGFLDRQAERVRLAYAACGLRQLHRIDRDGWVALVMG